MKASYVKSCLTSVLLLFLNSSLLFALEIQRFNNCIDVIKMVSPLLPSKPIFLEAGAYDGADTVAMLQLRPDATIHSFEPVPSIYKKLVFGTKQYPSIHTYQLALSDKIEETNFYISEPQKNAKNVIADASSSLLEPKEHGKYAHYVKFEKVIIVQTTTIDAWAKEHAVDHIDFMWLDMQGYELNALKASPNIFKTVKVVLTEVEFVEAYKGQYLYNDVKQWFESQGFVMIATDFDINKPRWLGNVLFVRK